MTMQDQKQYKENHFVIDNPPKQDSLKYIEMQMNKSNSIMSKGKLVCIKLDKIFIVLPYTYSKIELRMRNIMTNQRDLLDSISHLMNFYLINQRFHDHLKNKYIDFIKF